MDSQVSACRRSKFGSKYVEPAMLLITFSASIIGNLATNLIETQYCQYYLNISEESVCLNKTAPHFTEVQKYMTRFLSIMTVLGSVLPALISTFMGPWSDTYGRRPLMLSGSTGLLLSLCLWTWGSFAKVNPDYMLLFDIPFAFSGGTTLIGLGIYCYLCDQTTPDERAFRLGVMQCFSYIGTFVGTIGSPYAGQISYSFALLLAGCVALVLFLYILVVLKEKPITDQTQQKLVSKNPFQWSHIDSIYRTCWVKQSSSTVKILAAAGSLIFISSVENSGETGLLYLYLQKAFYWTVREWTYLHALMTVTSAFLSCLLTSKIVGLGDLQVLFIIVGIRLISAIGLFFGRQNWIIYAAGGFVSISGISRAAVRSYLSKIIDPNDIGKVYALLSLLEALGPLAGSFAYNTVYNATLDLSEYPSTFFLISIFLCLVMVFQIAIIAYLKSHPSNNPKPDVPDVLSMAVLPAVN